MNTYRAVPHGNSWGVAENGELLAVGLSKFRAGELVKALRDEQRRKYPLVQIMRADFPRYGRLHYERDPDPILDLRRVRLFALTTDNPGWQIKYGELRQRIVSPVVTLP